MSSFRFFADFFVSKIKVTNSSIIGSELLVKIHDMEPIYIGEIASKTHGRVTIEFNKGIRLFLEMNRTSAPKKLPIFFIANAEGQQYAGGINAIELFSESIKFKQPSSIAREHSKLTSEFGKDAALISYKVRISVEKIPVATKTHANPVVNNRATDILRTNEQYRQICRDLSAQVSSLEAKVGQMTAKHKNPTQVQYQRTTISTQQQQQTSTIGNTNKRVSFPEQSTGGRSRPSFDFKFDDDDPKQKKSRKGNKIDDDSMSSLVSPSIQDSNSSASDSMQNDSLDIITDSEIDNRRKKKKKGNNYSSVSESSSYNQDDVIDESFSDEDSPKRKSSKKKKTKDYSSIDDVIDISSEHNKKSKKQKKDSSSIEEIDDIYDESKSKSKSKAKSKPSKKKNDSSSIEEVEDFSDEPKSKSKSKSKAKPKQNKKAKEPSISSVDDFSSDDHKKASNSLPLVDSDGSFESDNKPKSAKRKSSSSHNLSDFKSVDSDVPTKQAPPANQLSADFDSDSFIPDNKPKKKSASGNADPFASNSSNESF